MSNIRKFGLQQWRFVVLSLAIFGLVAAVIPLSQSVRDHLELLESSPNGGSQWTLTQLNVEQARLQQALLLAMRSPDADLAPLRRRFDLYYSRSETVTSMRSSKYLTPDAQLIALLDSLQAQTIELATIIDQPDKELRYDLPILYAQIEAQDTFLQELSSKTTKIFAKTSDDHRAQLSKLLIQILVIALLLAVSFISVVVLLYRSVREARATQVTLTNVTARLQSTIGASLDAVIVSDQNGVLLDYNGAAEHVFGYSRDEVLGKQALHYLIPESNRSIMRSEIRQHLETGESPLVGKGLLQLNGLKKGGEVIPIEVSIAPAVDGDQTIFISFVRDISEREAIKENILRSRDEALKMAKAKSDFITIMSHEMRTPLNGVISAHEVLSSTTLTPYQNKFFSIARSSAAHLLSHVNDVLDIASLDASETAPRKDRFSPLEAIEEIMENAQSLARARGNSLGADFTGADAGFYIGDKRRFRSILINLLGNAIKFTQNGHIQIDFGTFLQDDETVCFEVHVTDNGLGIPKDKLEDIFNDFVRLNTGYDRDADGTGLGLSITRRMVQTMSGEMGVESEVGVGSTFWVKLPFVNCPSPETNLGEPAFNAPPSVGNRSQGIRALLVEDNAINRTLMLEFLEDVGLEVQTAENGQTGVEAANATKFDYIFMDISMPVLDGIAATKMLRGNMKGASADAKIIGFTAHSSQESRDDCLAAGMYDVLVKPVSRAGILSVLGFKPVAKTEAPTLAGELLDIQQIESIRDILGPERFAKTCARFRSEMKKGFQDLIQDLSNQPPASQPKDLVIQIHRLAGLSASMGASALHAKLAAAQSVAETDNIDALREELNAAAICLELTLGAEVYDEAVTANAAPRERPR
ncbi:hybrid sensor histidine kinase/response regulator [Falsihalocynthiibacter arcticus]|uniref:hybrid sensor histidine kinase/response regulator n=1 Tax=Falsihalocynthiibacter arcticus TaxID=1579316 RepID=UPI0030032FD7